MKIYTKTGDKGETGLFGGKRVSKDSLRMSAIGEVDELNAILGICRVEVSGTAKAGESKKNRHGLQKLNIEEKSLRAQTSGHSDLDAYSQMDMMLHQIQQELFELGTDLARPSDSGETALARKDVSQSGLPRKEDKNQNGLIEPINGDESLAAKAACRFYSKEARAQTSKSLTHLVHLKMDQVLQLEKWIDEIDPQLEPLKNFILPGGSVLAAHLHLARTVCRRAERAIVRLQKKEKIGEHIVPYVNRLSDLLFMMARWANKLDGMEEEKWNAR